MPRRSGCLQRRPAPSAQPAQPAAWGQRAPWRWVLPDLSTHAPHTDTWAHTGEAPLPSRHRELGTAGTGASSVASPGRGPAGLGAAGPWPTAWTGGRCLDRSARDGVWPWAVASSEHSWE